MSTIKPYLGLLGVIIAAAAVDFNDQVTSVALAEVTGNLGISHDPATWFTTVYVTAEVVGMALSPWMMITFTIRQFMLFTLLLNGVSSGLIPFTHPAAGLYILRTLQGLAEGFTIPMLFTAALRVLAPEIRLYGFAIYAFTATLTPALAAPLAALATGVVGWRLIFWETVPICVAAALLVWYGMAQEPPAYGRLRIFDWRGALLVLIGFGSLSVMLQQGNRLNWFNSPLISVLALLSGVGIPLFIANEWFHELPLMKPQILGRRNLAYALIAFFTFLIVGQSSSSLPIDFLQKVQGFKPSQVYQITVVIALLQLVMLPAMAVLLDHPWADARVVSFVGFALILVACIGASHVTIRWDRDQFYLWQVLQGIGQPMVVMPLLLMASNAVKGADEAPLVSGLINMPRAIASAAGTWLIQLIDRWRGDLHYNRLADQAGQDRFRVLQGHAVLPNHLTPLLANGQPRSSGSLSQFAQMIEQQARIMTISDTYLIFAAMTVFLIVVLIVLPERSLPPRLQLAKK
ncbi:MAG: MFS transporter [Proteobacteria bacterium]|nr:MFS transporter [Pseudomonadota bacterium]